MPDEVKINYTVENNEVDESKEKTSSDMEAKKQNKLALLEAILFITDEPLKIEKLQKDMKARKEEIEKLLIALKDKYEKADCGIKLSSVGGYKLVVKSEYVTRVSHLTPHADLSRGLLRVLSIIAYYEPIKQSDIVKVVGNRAYEYVKELEEQGLIRSEKKSRTKMLSTTPHFEDYFGAKKDQLKGMMGSVDKSIKPGKKEEKTGEKKEEPTIQNKVEKKIEQIQNEQ